MAVVVTEWWDLGGSTWVFGHVGSCQGIRFHIQLCHEREVLMKYMLILMAAYVLQRHRKGKLIEMLLDFVSDIPVRNKGGVGVNDLSSGIVCYVGDKTLAVGAEHNLHGGER